MMSFDYIIGNPPYQDSKALGSNKNSLKHTKTVYIYVI